MFSPNMRPLSRRSFMHGTSAAAVAAIAGMSFPKVMMAQTPAEIPPKEISGTAILTITGEPQSFNPDFQGDDNLWPIASNIYNSLFSLDNSFNVIPELATGYEIADDGLSITVPLNPLATWHDGTPVTSADVKYTVEQILKTPSSTASSLINAVESVDTPDEHTAVLMLSRPSASVIGFLSWYGVFMLPAHIYEGTDWATNEANQAPVGSGPFKFVSYDPGASVELEANPEYFGEGPYLERLVYQIIPDPNTAAQSLQNGEIDFVDGIPNTLVPTFEADPNFKIAPKVYPSPIYFGFNLEHEPLDNLDVRRAIGMAIDRDQIVATALGGFGTAEDRYYPSVIEWASNPDAVAPALDVDGANALLDEAGFPMNGNSRFKVRLLYFTGWQEVADTATVLKEQMGAIGVEVELVLLEYAAWEEQVEAGDFDIALQGGFQGPDPANLNLRWGTGSTLNRWHYSNSEFDELLKEGDAGSNQEERAKIYFQAEQILADDVPTIPVALQTYYSAFTSSMSGVWLDPEDPASSQVGMNRFTLTKLEG
ncbi:MAG TPA: ABC transporter substrate-binding protein [Thermomicrobiales bacterium]|nr:ABC transporter substrate-binding protein [Thermomicrobiales bacterium]